MISLNTNLKQPIKSGLFRRAALGNSHEILTDIYDDKTNIVIWQRDLGEDITLAAEKIIATMPALKMASVVTPQEAYTATHKTLGAAQYAHQLSEDIAQLVDMFCCLFDLKRAGLRLTALDHAMCPRFHVDKVPCRLVTTYQGSATQWLDHHHVDRSKLGVGNQGKPDEQSGLFETTSDIQQLRQGDVALLKGESWEGNQGAGLVHRSPQLPSETSRLLLTLDFIDD